MNEKRGNPVITIGRNNHMTGDEINEFFGRDSSDKESGSDWDELNEKDVSDFLSSDKCQSTNLPSAKTQVVKAQVKLNTAKPMVISGYLSQRGQLDQDKLKKTSGSESGKYFLAKPTKIRVANCQITDDEWKDRTDGRQITSISALYRGKLHQSQSSVDGNDSDWVLVGVVMGTTIKNDRNGKKFCLWNLTDLEGSDRGSPTCLGQTIAKLMLFRNAYEACWKETVGTVVAILQPQSLTNSNTNFKEKAFIVDNGLQVMVLGSSPDLAICQGKSKNGDPCRNFVNKAQCSWCSYHVQQGYFQATNRPGFVNIGMEKLNERKRKAMHNPSDDFQSWNPEKQPRTCGAGTKTAPASRTQISLDKLRQTGVATLARNWLAIPEPDKNDVDRAKESEKENVKKTPKTSKPVDMQENNGSVPATIAATQQSMTENEAKFSDMLKRPSAGSLNFMKHLIEKSSNNVVETGTSGPGAVKSQMISRGQSNSTTSKSTEQFTFASLRQRYQPNAEIPVRDDPKCYIDLGMKPVKLDAVSSEVYRAELNKLRYTAKVRDQGGHEAVMATKRAERLKAAVASSTVSKNNVSVLDSASKTAVSTVKKNAMGLTPEMMELLKQGSSNKALVETQKYLELDAKLGQIEKIDKMEQILCAQHEQECVLFVCEKCQTRTPMRPKMCVSEGHHVQTIKGTKRFFRCIKCKHRIVTYDKYPNESCAKCGACVFEKTGKLKEREVATEKLHVHGTEKRFISN